MSGAGVNHARGPGRPAALVAALVLAGIAAAPCSGQSLATAALPAPPPVEPTSAATDLPPSTVSPAIARFVRESGRDLPPPAAAPRPTVAAARSASEPGRRPSADDALPPTPTPPPAPAPAPAIDPPAPAARRAAASFALRAAPLEPEDRRFPINLGAALQLADARPLVVAAAQASVWVAEADLTRAKVLWLPTATFSVDYLRHDGGGPDFNKGIMTAPSVNFFMGGGGLIQSVNLSDAIFQPLQARQVLNARHFDVQAAKNDALLQVADAYFQVHQYRGTYAGALYTVDRGRDLVTRIEELSKELATRVEIDRAKNLLADLEQRASLARQEWRVRSADLTQVLRLDPRAVVEPLESDHAQVTLVDPGRPLDDLLPIALTNRPELGSRSALAGAAGIAVRREKNRPFLPLILVDGFQVSGNGPIQAGLFGLGYNSSMDQYRGRADVSFQAIWQLEGLGLGNLARIKARRGEQSRAIIDLRRAQDAVAGDVTRAQARVQSASARVLQADRALRTGIVTFNGQIEGLGQTRRFGDRLVLIFRPQETIYSLDLLSTAFEEYFSTVADYNRAQFELFHALGYPARELAELRTPGVPAPVDTARPGYLPPVGTGPPPVAR